MIVKRRHKASLECTYHYGGLVSVDILHARVAPEIKNRRGFNKVLSPAIKAGHLERESIEGECSKLYLTPDGAKAIGATLSRPGVIRLPQAMAIYEYICERMEMAPHKTAENEPPFCFRAWPSTVSKLLECKGLTPLPAEYADDPFVFDFARGLTLINTVLSPDNSNRKLAENIAALAASRTSVEPYATLGKRFGIVTLVPQLQRGQAIARYAREQGVTVPLYFAECASLRFRKT